VLHIHTLTSFAGRGAGVAQILGGIVQAAGLMLHVKTACLRTQVPITHNLEFHGGFLGPIPTIPAFRMLSGAGKLLPSADTNAIPDAETLSKIYECMVTVQAMDTIFYDAQRQGRFGFYMQCSGTAHARRTQWYRALHTPFY
jgi:hypothetical protein